MIEAQHIPEQRGRAADEPLRLVLSIADREMREELLAIEDESERQAHALKALKIGLLALKTARGRIDAEAVRREGDAILAELRMALNGHREGLRTQIQETLRGYFDPKSGKLDQRLRGLVARDGELETVLRRQVGHEGSELTRTLEAHFGPQSAIMKRLSPTDAKGLSQELMQRLETQSREERERLLREFSLDTDDSALSRLVARMKGSNEELGAGLTAKVDALVKELSLDQEASGLKRLRDELMTVLTGHAKDEAEFRQSVLQTLKSMEGAKKTAERTPLRGLTFEQALFEHVQHVAEGAGDVAELTVNTVGAIRKSKVGDIVLELGPETAAPGARVVIEAKDKQDYSLAKAREEMDIARKNRRAGFGVFVFAAGAAPNGLASFQRIGNDVYVVWDAEDPTSTPWVDAALTVARALAVRGAREREASEVDLDELDRSILEIEKRSDSLAEIHKYADTIVSSGEKIQARVRISRDAFARQVKALRELLTDLREANA
ncbi:MAG: hypothetical protein QNJ98_16370 [Planctomycetota bacterium]|nr:hypothetical protein [Planctomycetota bacterium]